MIAVFGGDGLEILPTLCDRAESSKGRHQRGQPRAPLAGEPVRPQRGEDVSRRIGFAFLCGTNCLQRAERSDVDACEGKAFVIFDGLDEVIDPAWRAEVTSIIELFCADFPASPVLVTSRLIGYSQAQLDRPSSLRSIAAFRQDQVEEYIRKCFALEEEISPDEAARWTEAFTEESSTHPEPSVPASTSGAGAAALPGGLDVLAAALGTHSPTAQPSHRPSHALGPFTLCE
jgi:hypothetical protein